MMSDTPQLTSDEYTLYVSLPREGNAIGNAALRRSLGWGRSRYAPARQGLLDKQLVSRCPGRGGALRRTSSSDDSIVGQLETIRPPIRESSPYQPLFEILRNDWAESRQFNALVVEQTAHQGRRDTGGHWTRPDLVAVGLKSFDYIPMQEFEIVTFEVKAAQHLSVVAVYEALAHRRSSTHSYVLAEIRAELADAHAERLRAVRDAATDHGIGMITFEDPADYETWDEIVPAARHDASPAALNSFIETQVSRSGRQAIADAVDLLRGHRIQPEVASLGDHEV